MLIRREIVFMMLILLLIRFRCVLLKCKMEVLRLIKVLRKIVGLLKNHYLCKAIVKMIGKMNIAKELENRYADGFLSVMPFVM